MELQSSSEGGDPSSAVVVEPVTEKTNYPLPNVPTGSMVYGCDELDVFDLELQKEFANASHRERFYEASASEAVDPLYSQGAVHLESEEEAPEYPIASVIRDTEVPSVAEDLKVSEMTRDPEFSRRLVKELAAVVRKHCEQPFVGCCSSSASNVEESEAIEGAPAQPSTAACSLPVPSFPSEVAVESVVSTNLAVGSGFCRDRRKEFEEDFYLVWNVLGDIFLGAQARAEAAHTQCAAPSSLNSGARGSPMTVSLLEQHERLMGAVGCGRKGVFIKRSAAFPPMKRNGRNSIDTEVSDSLSRLQVFSSPSAGPGTDPLTTATSSATSSNRGGEAPAVVASVAVDGWRDPRRNGILTGGVRVVVPKKDQCRLSAMQGSTEVEESITDFRRRPVNPYFGCTHGGFTTPGQAPQTEIPPDTMIGSINSSWGYFHGNKHSFDGLQYQHWYPWSIGSNSGMSTITSRRNQELLPDLSFGSAGDHGPHCRNGTSSGHRKIGGGSSTETHLERRPEGPVPSIHAAERKGMEGSDYLSSQTTFEPTVSVPAASSLFAMGSGCGSGVLDVTCVQEDVSKTPASRPHVVRPRPLKPSTFTHWAEARGAGGSGWVQNSLTTDGSGILAGGGEGSRGFKENNICPSNHSPFSACSTVGESRRGYSTEPSAKATCEEGT